MDKKNNRYAFEWYVKEQDEWYWKRSLRKMRKITALAATSAVISGISIVTVAFLALRK